MNFVFFCSSQWSVTCSIVRLEISVTENLSALYFFIFNGSPDVFNLLIFYFIMLFFIYFFNNYL